MKMLADLGINFRHLLHLASEMHFLADPAPRPASGIHQQISARLAGVSVAGDDRVCLVVRHELTTPSGRQLQASRDTFVIGGIDPTGMDRLRAIATPTTVDLRGITTRIAARLFGFRGAFLQGMGTANHVLSDIARHMPGRLEAFEVTFARPLYVGQTVELARDRDTFEVTDQRRHVVAYGTYRTAT